MSAEVHIVATGARTPLGLRSAPSAAAYRAGISALRDHPFMVDRVGDPMPGALDPTLDAAKLGPGRLIALADSAVREACAPLAADGRTPRLRLPLYLALPEIRPGFTGADVETVRSGLLCLEGLPVELSEVKAFAQGHAAGLLALAVAKEQLELGAAEACLVGGVDTYFEPDTMEWLDSNRQLEGAVGRSAFVPGEGAGCCLLMTEPARGRLQLDSLARLLAAATGRETKLIKTTDLCLGEGLTAVAERAVVSLAPPGPINTVICDINGERYRGDEWGFVCLRLSQYFDDPTAYWSPADSWGDIGAASGPLFVMLACEAAARAYAPGPRAMLWASSEGGLRAAAILDTTSLS